MMREAYVIGITGGSGSGKTSLLRSLRDAFQPNELAILSQDNYYRKREYQVRDTNGIHNFDLPESFVMDEFLSDLKRLGLGEQVDRMEYTYNNDAATPALINISPAPVIIAEGLFLMHIEEIREELDLSIFVEVNDVLKLKRRIMRDQAERNYPLDDVLYRYEHHVLPSYRQFILPYRDMTDIIINNNRAMTSAMEVIRGHVRNVLSENQD
jgi:uridine kinase